jgi:hypothetical protein
MALIRFMIMIKWLPRGQHRRSGEDHEGFAGYPTASDS